MRLSSISSSLAFRLLTLLAVIYVVVAGVEIWRTTNSATYNREVYPEAHTDPLEGPMVVEYDFVAQHAQLDGLWVFFKFPKGTAAEEGELILSLRRAGTDAPFWSQSFDCKQAAFLKPGFLCRIGGLPLEKGAHYVLTYAMPEMKPGTGWRLSYCTREKVASTVSWGNEVRHSAEPSMCWLEKSPRFPIRNILIGVFLLALCSIAARENTRFYIPATLVAATACILCATYHWQVNLWTFWGNFWPDGYVGLGYKVYQLVTGRISLQACAAFFQNDRTAQVFFLPGIMGLFQAMGLSVKGAFLAANGFFLVVATAVLLSLLRLYKITSDRATIATILLFFSHRCVIGGVSEFQSDLAGAVVAMCFVYSLLRALETPEPRLRLRWYLICGVMGFFAITTRMALLPLPLIPICLFLWSLVFERQRPLRERWAYLIPSAVAAVLVCGSWSLFGLWGTLKLNWGFASTFTYLFTWKGFFPNFLQGMQWSLLVVLVFWKRLFFDRAFVAVVGSAAGLQALLVYSQQPNWLRYHDAAAAVGVMLLVWPLKEWPRWQHAFLVLAWVSVVANAFIP
jgi:hypothetical protein